MSTQSTFQGFDETEYFTEILPGVFSDAQVSAAMVTAAVGELWTEVNANTKRVLMSWLGQAASLKKWEGRRHVRENTGNEFIVTSEKFESTESIDMDDMEDFAERDALTERVRLMGEAAAQHKDSLIGSFLTNDSTTAVAYDGVPLFSASHTRKDGSTYSNFTTGGSAPWYLMDTSARAKGVVFVTRKGYETRTVMAQQDGNLEGFMTDKHYFGVKARVAVHPGEPSRMYRSDTTLDDTNFRLEWTKITSYKGDGGRPIAVRPTVLMVSPANEFAARDILNRSLIDAGESNPLEGMVELVVNPYL